MKRRQLVLVAGAVGLLAMVFLSIAAAGTSRTERSASAAAVAPPPVANAQAIKAEYGGQSITFVGDSVGNSHKRDLMLAQRFTKDTGIKVNVVPHPAASDASYSQLARAFSSKSDSIDVAMIDAIWPGAFAPYLVDLKPEARRQQAKLHSAGHRPEQHGRRQARRDAVVRRLRDALLPHRPAAEVRHPSRRRPGRAVAMAKKIQDGRAAANPNFCGFVFQGNAYEGLTCNALEWLASSGGGQIIEQRQGHDQQPEGGRRSSNLMRGWVGTITPRGVTTYQEGEARNAFRAATPPSCATGRTPTRSARAPTRRSRASSTSPPLPHGERHGRARSAAGSSRCPGTPKNCRRLRSSSSAT